MSDDGKIIDFAEARKRVAGGSTLDVMEARDKTGKWCTHKHILVGRDFGVVECSDCGVALNAHEVLLGFANEERRFWFDNKIAINELERLRKSIAELKAEEKRIKARVRRAQQSVDAAEVKLFTRGMVEKLEGGEP
jgi:uncharacterized small protein (DUF1192 family)